MAKATAVRYTRKKKKDTDALRTAWHVLEEWVEVNRQQIVVIGGIALGAALLFGLMYYFLEFRYNKAQAAYSDAFRKYTATVSATPIPSQPGQPKQVTYPDKQAKFTDAAAAFEALSAGYSQYKDIGQYYAALSYLEDVDPPKGMQILQSLASGSSEVRYQARLALAEQFEKQGKYEESEKNFAQLVDEPGGLPSVYLRTRLGSVKERLNKPTEAAEQYRTVVDLDRNSPLGTEAEKGLQRVDPVAAAKLPPKEGTGAPGAGGNPAFTQKMSQP